MSRQSVAGYKEDYLEPRMLLRHLEVLWGVIVKLVRASIKDTQFRSEKIEMKLVDKGGDVENVNGGNQPACLRIVASHQSFENVCRLGCTYFILADIWKYLASLEQEGITTIRVRFTSMWNTKYFAIFHGLLLKSNSEHCARNGYSNLQ